ncbi:hypothetical protein PVA38_11330 [Streptococcus pneumoniae D39]|nr:hypothetical protein PVA38_11330 [Streptococcus pneumoniae D39]
MYKRQSWSPTFTMLTMLSFLSIDFFFCTDIIRMSCILKVNIVFSIYPVSYTHLRAHETVLDLVCRLLLEKKKK